MFRRCPVTCIAPAAAALASSRGKLQATCEAPFFLWLLHAQFLMRFWTDMYFDMQQMPVFFPSDRWHGPSPNPLALSQPYFCT